MDHRPGEGPRPAAAGHCGAADCAMVAWALAATGLRHPAALRAVAGTLEAPTVAFAPRELAARRRRTALAPPPSRDTR